MPTPNRYELAVDGSGGVHVFDRVAARTSYTISPTLGEPELRYEGLRQVLPVLLDENLEPASAPTAWRAIGPLEKAHRVVVVVLPRAAAASAAWIDRLAEYDDFARTSLGRRVLPVSGSSSEKLDEVSFFEPVLAALAEKQAREGSCSLSSSEPNLLGTRFAIMPDPDLRQVAASIAAREYASRDYPRKRCASFLQYYVQHPVGRVEARARSFANERVDGKRLASMLRQAVVSGQPFSFVRVGEGEGCFLSFAKYLADRSPHNEVFGVCAKDIYRVWFGRNILDAGEREVSSARALYDDAIANADVVGVPTPARVVYEYGHFVNDVEKHGFSRGYVGTSEVLSHLKDAIPRSKLLTDCDIARPLYDWQDWESSLATTLPPLLKRVRRVALVTCHERLGPALERVLDLDTVQTHSIPPERGRLHGDGYVGGDHFHDHFDGVCHALRHDPAPVVLVAAGFLGKAYCSVAKLAGSVAIDIGSLADYWAGANTRKKNRWFIPSPFAFD